MRKKILIVEDNTELLELLRIFLREAGYSVATATDGIAALKKVRTCEPDLIVLDLVLPELDGFAVCEVLRKSPATADVPVIVLTGLKSEITRYAGMESGATEFVTKPVTPSHLVSRIEHWLNNPPGPPAHQGRKPRALRMPSGVS
jgi:two-component system, OmpR family, alkaline phosphatase synthesis response regulator PhoP